MSDQPLASVPRTTLDAICPRQLIGRGGAVADGRVAGRPRNQVVRPEDLFVAAPRDRDDLSRTITDHRFQLDLPSFASAPSKNSDRRGLMAA